MHRRIAHLAADCCCVRLSNKESESLKVFEGGDFSVSTSVQLSEGAPEFGVAQRKTGIVSLATWKSRWVLMVLPIGRASLFEYSHSRLSFSSSFDCPVNTSALLILNDDVDDCALVIFGTDEGARASKVHVARLTFSTESLSVKPLKIWSCTGGVSSLARFENLVLVGYTSCEGVGMFDPFSFEDPASPTLGSRQRSAPRSIEDQGKVDVIPNRISGEMVPVWVTTKGNKIITVTQCGTLSIYDDVDLDSPEWTLFLGFDCLGAESIPTVDAVVVCGWRGEVALVDLSTGQVSRFARTKDSARVEDFAVSVSSDSRLLLLQVDADDSTSLKVFDFGRTALFGSSRMGIGAKISENEDALVYIGSDENGTSGDALETKVLLREAWELMVDEPE